jgi:transcriptional regulator with XRE-family HTH domain
MTGTRLRAIRKKLGLTQSAFGTALGYKSAPQVRVSELERGVVPISRQVEIICGYLERLWDDRLGGKR